MYKFAWNVEISDNALNNFVLGLSHLNKQVVLHKMGTKKLQLNNVSLEWFQGQILKMLKKMKSIQDSSWLDCCS